MDLDWKRFDKGLMGDEVKPISYNIKTQTGDENTSLFRNKAMLFWYSDHFYFDLHPQLKHYSPSTSSHVHITFRLLLPFQQDNFK